MKKYVFIATTKHGKKYRAEMITATADENLRDVFARVKGLQSVNICPTAKEARGVCDSMNADYLKEGILYGSVEQRKGRGVVASWLDELLDFGFTGAEIARECGCSTSMILMMRDGYTPQNGRLAGKIKALHAYTFDA